MKSFDRLSSEFHRFTTRRYIEVIESVFLVWIQLEGQSVFTSGVRKFYFLEKRIVIGVSGSS